VSLDSPPLRLTRAGIFIVLAALVALLGAAAKHSQFDGASHTGYLSKAVKMAGTRSQPDSGSPSSRYIASPVDDVPLIAGEERLFPAPVVASFTPISLSSPPLRA
jgi:hypothetical protein